MKKLCIDFSEITKLIENHRQNAYQKINEEHVLLCFEIGGKLSAKLESKQWGDKTIETLANYIKNKNPTLKGFDKRGLYRMIQFYNAYRHNIIVSSLLSQISWTNHLIILSKCKRDEEREFYMRLCIKNKYSTRELNRQISTKYYERYLLSDGKALDSNEKTIDEDDIPNSRVLDHFSLEFLDLPISYTEKDLRKAIVKNLKQFVLEIGKDFTFVDEEHRITVGDQDFYIDLLFYNRTYKCLVAFELKLGEFKPEYVSKMDFYLEALDTFERKDNENPSVGIILCSTKNKTIVEFSKSRSISQSMVSTYSTNLIDLKAIQNAINKYRELLEKNNVVQKEVKE